MTTFYDILIGLPLTEAVDKALTLPDRAVLEKNLQQFRTFLTLMDNLPAIEECLKKCPYTVKELPFQDILDVLVERKQDLKDKFDLPHEISVFSGVSEELIRTAINVQMTIFSKNT